MISILFLAADPSNNSRLRLGEEYREIQEKLQLAKDREQFVLNQRFAVRPADISQAMLDVNPQIVHFSGHGLSEGAIYLEDIDGLAQPVSPEALAALFEQFSNDVQCVVLNACYSDIQAQAIAHHVRFVIGMNEDIGDKAGIAFSIGFYQALGAGRSYEDAFKLGRVQIELQGIPEDMIPVLHSFNKINGQPGSSFERLSTVSGASDSDTFPRSRDDFGDLNRREARERIESFIDQLQIALQRGVVDRDAAMRKMDAILELTRYAQQDAQFAPDEIDRIFRRGSEATRIIALTLVEVSPSTVSLPIALEAVSRPRSPWEQYLGLQVIEELIPVLSPSEKEEVREVIVRQQGGQTGQYITPANAGRWELATRILKSIKKK